ncbi:hypothetical protein PHLCEN_2v9263 [Hermanssonia centrifuga]|uniref:Transmembrane protein n=1 Tax=Hermanssonia centrifuga TaxID=98765 RepID=A0A2R6NRE1_9APHY|nr:hypothetical protein PHLCEN_2v9263 [Hermanssonia centrifuga]
MSNDNTTIYDDSGGLVDYLPQPGYWYNLSGNIATSNWHNATLSGVNQAATCVSIIFGSRVLVYGTLRGMPNTNPTPTTSIYSIDGNVVRSYTAPQVTVDQNGVLFFDSGVITTGPLQHVLWVNVTSASPDFPYYLDYLLVVSNPSPDASVPPPPPPSPTTSTSHTSSTIVSTSLTSSTTIQLSQPNTPSPTAARTSSAVSHVNVGPIAGGVVGGVVVLITALVLLLRCRRRKKYGNLHDNNVVDFVGGRIMQESGGVGNSALGVTPYILPRDYDTASAPMVPRHTGAATLLPGFLSGNRMGAQARPSGKVRSPQILSPSAGPIFQPNEDSPRDLYGSDRNTEFPSPVASDHASDSKTHLLVSQRHINSPSTGDADISYYSTSSRERPSSLHVEGSQSPPPTPIVPASVYSPRGF